jgi:hypothetical protein
MARWTSRQGLWLDCTGAGELYIGVTAGVERERLLVHGVNKSPADLVSVVAQAGVIVVDNLTDAGKARFVSDSYSPPMDKGGARARHVRNAEGFITKAVASFNQRETDNYLRIAEVYATLALAEDGEKP